MWLVRFLVTILLLYYHSCAANSYGWSLFRTALYSGMFQCDHRKDQNRTVSDTKVYFYDFQSKVNLSFPIDSALEGLTSYITLNESRKLIFFVPGYKSHINKASVDLIRHSFKDVPNIYLVIIDHSPYTTNAYGLKKSYARSVSFSYYIGKALGELLAGLRKRGYPSKNIHCIGNSLGAQMLGYAGVTYHNITSEKVARITGIDPAGPCFSNALIEEQIRSGVAEYVDVYHCNAGGLGTTAVLADADFFLNRGKNQPHCGGLSSALPGYGEYSTSKCSHKACIRYWAKTVQHPGWYLAWLCDSYEDFKAGKCAGHPVTIAGYHNPGNMTGMFFVSTSLHGVEKR